MPGIADATLLDLLNKNKSEKTRFEDLRKGELPCQLLFVSKSELANQFPKITHSGTNV